MQAAAPAFAQKIDKNGRCRAASVKFAKADVCKGVAAASAAAAHAGKSGRQVVSAFIGTAFAQNDAGSRTAKRWSRRQHADTGELTDPALPEITMAKPSSYTMGWDTIVRFVATGK